MNNDSNKDKDNAEAKDKESKDKCIHGSEIN